MATRLEHANVCVRDLDAMIRFLETAFPEFHVRGEGTSNDGMRRSFPSVGLRKRFPEGALAKGSLDGSP